jgi:secreted PhoX family phosphatase
VDSVAEQPVIVDTVPPFVSVAENFTSDLLLPEGFSYRIIFQEQVDLVTRADGKQFPAKGLHDLTVFIPDKESPETKGLIYVSHEDKIANDNLGDGGGATVFPIELKDGKWQVTGNFDHIDFSAVGGTNRNCGGSLTPNGTVFTCEETWAWNTEYLYQKGKGHRDTSWINGRPLWQNMGYIVEVDPVDRKVLRKHWKMGKFVHEDALCTADGKYVYLTDDNGPGVFFRFVADKAFDYTNGQLQAYKQSSDGESGEWLNLAMDTLSLINCHKEAIKKGATMFIRHEWIEEINGKFYISETGEDNFDWSHSEQLGGTVPKYVRDSLKTGNYTYDDCFGRILEFDPSTNKMRSYLEGGFFSDSSGCFSNPDCNTSVNIGGRTFLVISEDINGYDRGRAGKDGEAKKQLCNEIYFLDMSIENPTVNDLLRFCAAPIGSETTGVIFLPDGTMVLNIQHPGTKNPAPFNKSCTVIVEGFK